MNKITDILKNAKSTIDDIGGNPWGKIDGHWMRIRGPDLRLFGDGCISQRYFTAKIGEKYSTSASKKSKNKGRG